MIAEGQPCETQAELYRRTEHPLVLLRDRQTSPVFAAA
jgi:hypothetical protein